MIAASPTYRALLTLLTAHLALASLSAQAEELQFDLSGVALSADGQSAVGPFDMTFMLDTSSGMQQFTRAPSGCMTGFNVGGATFSNVNMSINGHSAMAANTLLGVYSGGDILDAAMQFTNSGSTFTWEFGGHGGSTCVPGNDPLATMFLDVGAGSSGAFDTQAGFMDLQFDNVSVRAVGVPEPETLGLLVLGFAGVVLYRRLTA